MRPEDKDARQDQRAFASGATLAELEQYIAFLRSLGAPDDAHPKVGVSDNYEVTMMICVVERAAVHLPDASQVKSALARMRVPAGRISDLPGLVRARDEACAGCQDGAPSAIPTTTTTIHCPARPAAFTPCRPLTRPRRRLLVARAAGRRILVTMSPYPARPRRHLATSPFNAPDPEPPAERFAVGDRVTHDTYGLGTVTGIEEGTALLIDFGSHVQRILTPSAKLSKL